MIERTADLWWKNAVVYCLDPETFADSDGDGCGDLVGLTDRMDYLAGIGVTCIWLMPFYPSPNRDDGYDIVDHFGVNGAMGTPGDLVEMVLTADDRGVRVIADLVVNHTSNQHEWFQRSRADRDSPYRDFYVWADEPPPDAKDIKPVFPDAEDSVWTYDEEAGQYFLHHFYRHQPDLNVANATVRDAIAKIMGFWLQQGLCGFRIDAVPFLIETHGIAASEEKGRDPHDLLREMRGFASRRKGDQVLLGEVNLPPDQLEAYFGGERGDQLQMLFAFTVNQAMYLAFARGEAAPIAEALRGAAAAARRLPVGPLRAQPRRADPRQAERGRAAGGLRGLRPGPRDAALRPRAAAAPADACSRGMPIASISHTACCSRCRGRRCCSTARRSGWPRTSRSRGG